MHTPSPLSALASVATGKISSDGMIVARRCTQSEYCAV